MHENPYFSLYYCTHFSFAIQMHFSLLKATSVTVHIGLSSTVMVQPNRAYTLIWPIYASREKSSPMMHWKHYDASDECMRVGIRDYYLIHNFIWVQLILLKSSSVQFKYSGETDCSQWGRCICHSWPAESPSWEERNTNRVCRRCEKQLCQECKKNILTDFI